MDYLGEMRQAIRMLCSNDKNHANGKYILITT